MIEIKDVKNVILNNIDIIDKHSRMHRSPPRSRQIFPDSKNLKITVIYIDLVEIKVVWNYVIKNFELHDQLLKIHSPRVSEVGKI